MSGIISLFSPAKKGTTETSVSPVNGEPINTLQEKILTGVGSDPGSTASLGGNSDTPKDVNKDESWFAYAYKKCCLFKSFTWNIMLLIAYNTGKILKASYNLFAEPIGFKGFKLCDEKCCNQPEESGDSEKVPTSSK